MSTSLTRRFEKEYLDDLNSPERYEKILSDLVRVFTVIKRYEAAMSKLEPIVWQLAARRKSNKPIRVLEVGGGLGGFTAHFLKWAAQRDIELDYTFTDINEHGLKLAKKRLLTGQIGKGSVIKIEKFDARDLDKTAPQSFDLVIGLLLLHHIADDEEVIKFFKKVDRVSTSLFFYDSERSWRGLIGTWLALRAFRVCKGLKHDGVLSFRRSYTIPELIDLLERTNLNYLEIGKIKPWELCVRGIKQ